MADEPKHQVKVEVESSSWPWVIGWLALVALCWGDPDLLDVLARWCRIWMEQHP